MKKSLLLIATAVFSTACSFPAYEKLYYTDFTRYAHEDFFVSSLTEYTGNPYTALGNIVVEYYRGSGSGQQKPADSQDMLDRLVQAAKKVGANGIIGYSCSSIGIEYDPAKWIASGIAVHFDNPPHIPNNLPLVAPIDTPNAMDFLQETVDYLIANDIRFLIWPSANEEFYFDLEQKTHIPRQEFDTKYGEDIRNTIVSMYQKARKAHRKSIRQTRRQNFTKWRNATGNESEYD